MADVNINAANISAIQTAEQTSAPSTPASGFRKLWTTDGGIVETNDSGQHLNALGWFDVKAYGAKGDNSTDDTTAIQAAIDAAETAGGGVIFFPEGIYVVGGALQDTLGANAQLVLPDVDADTDQQISLVFKGATSPYILPSTARSIQTPTNGSILRGTLNTGTDGNMIGAIGTGDNGDFTNVMVYFEDIMFRMPNNPVLTCLDLENVVAARFRNVSVDSGEFGSNDLTEPTTTASYGIKLPAESNGVLLNSDGLNIIGFYTGILLGEHCNLDNITIFGCKYAVEVPGTSYHAMRIGRLTDQTCESGLKFTGGDSRIEIDQYNIQKYADGLHGAYWAERVYDIDDSNNYGYGQIRFHINDPDVGLSNNSWTVNGAKNISAFHLKGGFWSLQNWLEPSGTGTATFSNIPSHIKKLSVEFQVRSTQTGVAQESMTIALNSDTTDANYRRSHSHVQGNGSPATTGSGGADDRYIATVPANNAPSGSSCSGRIEIMNPTGTTFNKNILVSSTGRVDTSTLYQRRTDVGIEWENTAAVSTLAISLAAGNFVSGSRVELWVMT